LIQRYEKKMVTTTYEVWILCDIIRSLINRRLLLRDGDQVDFDPLYAVNLIDSIYRGYPIGGITVWATDDLEVFPSDFVGPVMLKNEMKSGSQKIVIKGQKLIHTLAGLLMVDDDTKRHLPEWDVEFSLETESSLDGGRYPFSVNKLLDTASFLEEEAIMKSIGCNESVLRRADKLASAVFACNIPVVTVYGADLDTAKKIESFLNG